VTDWTADPNDTKEPARDKIRQTPMVRRAVGDSDPHRGVDSHLRHSRQEHSRATSKKAQRYSIAGFIETRNLFNLALQKHSGGLIHA
jgi:hypothetical protein